MIPTVRQQLNKLPEKLRQSAYRCLFKNKSTVFLDTETGSIKKAMSLCYYTSDINECNDSKAVHDFICKLILYEDSDLISEVFESNYKLN